jgi:hypothetical protein
MASPFDTLTLDQIRAQLRLATPPWAATNAAFAAGDHWQAGAGWTGPRPDTGTAEGQAAMGEIARAFTPQNAIGETTERHVLGVVGKEPAWGLTPRRPLAAAGRGSRPTRAEQALIDEAAAALTAWWDARKVLSALQGLARGLLLDGRAPLRLFVPAGRRVVAPDGTPRVPLTPTLGAGLDLLYVDAPAAAVAAVLTDPQTQDTCSVLLYRRGGAQLFEAGTEEVAELSYVDRATGATVLRIVSGDPAREAAERWTYPLGGHRLLDEAARPALITDPVRRLQQQLNMARTMSGRNVVQGGFLERIILGGQMPGEYVDDPTVAPGPDGRRTRFVPRPLRVGAGRTNFISGQPIRDAQGRVTGYTSPSVVYRDPVSTATFRESSDDCYRAILQETRQLHALLSGDAAASGVSRVQARADFAKSLLQTKAELDALGRWLIETALGLAAIFAGTPGRFDGLRADFACRLDTGPLSAEERAQIVAEVAAGLMSVETALTLLGHDDPDAERARIAAARTPAPDPPAPDAGAQDTPAGAAGGAPDSQPTQGGL